jgi:hypothetical protein
MDGHHLLPHQVKTALDTAALQHQRIVVLTCGVSGSGMTTLAHSIIAQYPNFIRMSIDKYIDETHGVYNKDFPASKYAERQEEARKAVKEESRLLLGEGEGRGG